jgi:hypothetical protein
MNKSSLLFWMLMHRMTYRHFFFLFSFEVFDEKNDDNYKKKDSYDGDIGNHIPDPDSDLFFYNSNNRCLAAKGKWRISDIEFYVEVI